MLTKTERTPFEPPSTGLQVARAGNLASVRVRGNCTTLQNGPRPT